MGDANTYLIPGKENKAYQVHYLFFYDESPYKNSFAHYIEKEIHAVLRHEFDSYNIRFLTNNPSEWYLPQKTNSSNNRRRTRRSQSAGFIWHKVPIISESFRAVATLSQRATSCQTHGWCLELHHSRQPTHGHVAGTQGFLLGRKKHARREMRQ